MKKATLALVCVLMGTATMSSCASVNTVERETPIGTRHVIADKRVITDESLANKVSIIGVNDATTPGGFLQIQIEVLNESRSMQDFNYRIEWFDMNGMAINTPSSVWIPRQIEGKETLTITAVAPTPTAKDFRVKFLENVRDN